MEGKGIDLDRIRSSYYSLMSACDAVIVEGIGGLMVPIKRDFLVCDLIKEFSLPVILVAGVSLGTLNHTLLSLKVMNISQITIAGITLNNPFSGGNGLAERTNPDTIRRLSDVPVIGEVPFITPLTEKTLMDASKSINYDIIKKYL